MNTSWLNHESRFFLKVRICSALQPFCKQFFLQNESSCLHTVLWWRGKFSILFLCSHKWAYRNTQKHIYAGILFPTSLFSLSLYTLLLFHTPTPFVICAMRGQGVWCLFPSHWVRNIVKEKIDACMGTNGQPGISGMRHWTMDGSASFRARSGCMSSALFTLSWEAASAESGLWLLELLPAEELRPRAPVQALHKSMPI